MHRGKYHLNLDLVYDKDGSNQTNVREYRRGNEELTVQRNCQHRMHKTKDEDTQNKNIATYVLDTTIGKQTQITNNWR